LHAGDHYWIDLGPSDLGSVVDLGPATDDGRDFMDDLCSLHSAARAGW